MDQTTMFYTPSPFEDLDENLPQKNENKSIYEIALNSLQLSSIPAHLPCREEENNIIFNWLKNGIKSGGGYAYYISGMPGTGKTATVREVILTLKNEYLSGKLPEFQYIEVNGMRVTNPHQIYSQIWSSISGDLIPPTSALTV